MKNLAGITYSDTFSLLMEGGHGPGPQLMGQNTLKPGLLRGILSESTKCLLNAFPSPLVYNLTQSLDQDLYE